MVYPVATPEHILFFVDHGYLIIPDAIINQFTGETVRPASR